MNQAIIDHAVDVLINTRDFCGNEKEAVIDLAIDDYKLSMSDAKKLYSLANFQANNQWNNIKKQAGVPEKYIF